MNHREQMDKTAAKPPAMFWSGETLSERLKTLIEPFVPERVDCAAYRLAIGPEVYVSPTDQTAEPATVSVRKLSEEEAFTVPPGQFAFLLTEEVVSVPADALAFISIRAKTKFRGLVNVSGFHVDPGYHGQLTFAVFNAGPVPVHLKRGQQIFLIWYANLDCETAFKKDGTLKKGLDTDYVTAIAGELQSFASLSKKIKDVDKALGDRVNAIEKEQTYYRAIALIGVAIAISLSVNWLRDVYWSRPNSAPQVTSAPSSSPAPQVTSAPSSSPAPQVTPTPPLQKP
jgi:dCTP deaminase